MTRLTYKTSMDDNTFEHETHTMELDSYEHALDIAYDLEHGDFGGIICFDIKIQEA
jgi:hypothetical protein